jgi:hypothetical protein
VKIFDYKTKKVVKPTIKVPAIIILLIFIVLLHKPVFIAMAKVLEVPRSDEKCDVIVVEGGPAFSEYFVTQALKAYTSGQAEKIILVLHTYDLKPTIFGISNYRPFVEAAFDSLGIPKEDYKLLMLDVPDPYTYNSAVALADTIKNIESLLVFSDNFHMRRSYLTFKKVFEPKGVKVFPYTYDIYLNSKNWWTSGNGWRRVLSEYIKLIFYWINGYI